MANTTSRFSKPVFKWSCVEVIECVLACKDDLIDCQLQTGHGVPLVGWAEAWRGPPSSLLPKSVGLAKPRPTLLLGAKFTIQIMDKRSIIALGIVHCSTHARVALAEAQVIGGIRFRRLARSPIPAASILQIHNVNRVILHHLAASLKTQVIHATDAL